jgi:dipeptidyl aminopeptidase/acylaminoacyl peptidase
MSRFTFHPAIENAPVWSPDGSQVVFRSSRNGVNDLFERSASDTPDEQPLLVTSQAKSPLGWSPDGRSCFTARRIQRPRRTCGPSPSRASGNRSLSCKAALTRLKDSFRPMDGGSRMRPTSRVSYEIYIRTFPEAGGKWQVSTAGGRQPRWRRDGQELFYVAADARLMAVPIRVGPDTHAPQAGSPVPVFQTRLATGQNIAPAGFMARAQYSVARDGRFLMNVTAEDTTLSPITLVLNWVTVLQK